MKFQVERNDFTETVAWTARTLPARPTPALQIMSGLLLVATSAGLELSAFDYEVGARGGVDASVLEEGRALVSGRLLAEITRSLPAAPIEVSTDGNRLLISCGSTRFTLPTLPVEDYPELPVLPPVTGRLESGAFAAAVGQVVIAAGRDDTLPVLTGVKVEIDGDQLTLAATDRYRLSVRTLNWRPEDPEHTASALLPARTLAETARSLAGSSAEVAISLGAGAGGEALAGFSDGTRRTTTRLVEGQFPDYRKLLPASSPLSADVNVAALAEAVKRVRLVASGTSPVQLAFSAGQLRLEAGTGGEAEAREDLDAVYDGPDLTVAFNPGYLLDGLGALESDTVAIGFVSADDPVESARKPAVLTGKTTEGTAPDFRYLLMPVRLSG
jgi:DNA polymerase-3 subunit beta